MGKDWGVVKAVVLTWDHYREVYATMIQRNFPSDWASFRGGT
jgi:hypothetical protein